MAHGQPVLARLQLSQDADVGGAAAVVVPCQDRAGVGRPMQREHGVAGTLGGHDVGGGASDLEVVGIYLPASGEVGQAIKLVIGGPANLTAHLTTVSQPGVPSVEQPSTSRPRRGVKVAG
jgi:hypothetical protein